MKKSKFKIIQKNEEIEKLKFTIEKQKKQISGQSRKINQLMFKNYSDEESDEECECDNCWKDQEINNQRNKIIMLENEAKQFKLIKDELSITKCNIFLI